MRSSLKETIRLFINAMNPFYRNPIIGYADYDHLKEGRKKLSNPHLDQALIKTILASCQQVVDACRQLSGEYLLETALVDGQLRVNVFEIVEPDGSGVINIFNSNWVDEGLPCYTLNVVDNKAVLRALIAEAFGCFYDEFTPIQSWTINLSMEDQRKLGITLLTA